VNPSLSLGRIAGVRISINWSWLIVFALIAWTLASTVFPSQNPEGCQNPGSKPEPGFETPHPPPPQDAASSPRDPKALPTGRARSPRGSEQRVDRPAGKPARPLPA
jgi:hypothetical protein